MNRKGFLNKVVEIYFRDSCNVSEAIDRAEKELQITNGQFIEWFGKNTNSVKY